MNDSKNAVLNYNELDLDDSFNFDELEKQFEAGLEESLSELEFLEEDKAKISNPDNLGNAVMGVVWDQFVIQIGAVAGDDFIKENRGLKLDLRDEAHIQTTENFAEGKIAPHNTEIDYQQRYDDWQNNFQKNEDGSIKTRVDNRTNEDKAVLRVKDTKKDPNGENYNANYNAREFIDKDRPKGSKTVNKDHTISAAEIIRDPEAAAHMTREEQAAFANNEKNLVDLDSAANQSKSDSKMEDWLNSGRNGEKPADRFDIDENELRERDKEAREEYEKQKKEAEERSIVTGKKSQRAEAFRIGGKALRAAVMGLL
ncbi:MAG: cation diffusion facilitator family transporter, partial [Prevotella sp.]|nr:cation diffusion facilitator family transporter [Prevotella sp.]